MYILVNEVQHTFEIVPRKKNAVMTWIYIYIYKLLYIELAFKIALFWPFCQCLDAKITLKGEVNVFF